MYFPLERKMMGGEHPNVEKHDFGDQNYSLVFNQNSQ
jgi:hypothetical protein